LRLHEAEGQSRTEDDRNSHLAHQVRERAHVILVPVRQHDAADHVLALDQVREVGEDEVDAEMLVAREREPGVDDHDRSLRLVGGHVLPHLAEAAEWDDAASAHRGRSVLPRYGDAGLRTPASSRQARIRSSLCSVGSTIGRRWPPTSWPSRLSAALIAIGLVATLSRS